MSETNAEMVVEENDDVVINPSAAGTAMENELESLRKQLQERDVEVKALVAKKDELLDEKKKATKAEQNALDKLKKEEEEKLRKNGDFEKLVQAAEERANKAEEQVRKLCEAQLTNSINTQSLQIATEMRGRPESIEILAECVAKEIRSLVDENGSLSETNKTRVIQKMVDQAKYKPLLLGNLSTGGGAEGGRGGASKSLKEMSEAEQLTLYKQNPEKWRLLKNATA